MNYYKRPWDDTTGEDPTDAWGTSDYYLETDAEGWVCRQIQHFAQGQALKYGPDNPEDEYGALADQPLELPEFQEYRITAAEFEAAWQALAHHS